MKTMKKILSLITAALTACTLSVGVFAADLSTNEQAIVSYLDGVTIGGVSLSDEYIVQAQNYFMQDGVDVTAAQKDALLADLADAVAYCNTNDIKGIATLTTEGTTIDASALKNLSTDQKAKLLEYSSTAAKDLGLTFTYYPVKKKAVITDASGAVVTEITHAIKNTGFSGYEYILMVSGVLAHSLLLQL
jgi:hypothetical protein